MTEKPAPALVTLLTSIVTSTGAPGRVLAVGSPRETLSVGSSATPLTSTWNTDDV